MAGLCAPLLAVRRCPCGHLRMTRGRCGSLLLHRDGLAPSTPCRSPGALRLSPNSGGTHRVLVGVTDCGVGISAENADRLFNAFFTTKSSGMGMGLSICRSIIEAHGGRLWATANMPHGATFQFTLPVNADTAS